MFAHVDEKGGFSLKCVPGRGWLILAGLPSTWFVKKVAQNGLDITDSGVTLESGEDAGVVSVTVSDRISVVNGDVADRSGRPVTHYVVLAFPASSSLWSVPARYHRAVQPDQNGLFEIRGLPTGTYRLVALDQIPARWPSPSVLELMSRVATRVSVRDGEIVRQRLILQRQVDIE
jgi:hypothetical protein